MRCLRRFMQPSNEHYDFDFVFFNLAVVWEGYKIPFKIFIQIF